MDVVLGLLGLASVFVGLREGVCTTSVMSSGPPVDPHRGGNVEERLFQREKEGDGKIFPVDSAQRSTRGKARRTVALEILDLA